MFIIFYITVNGFINVAPLGHCDTLSLLHWVTVIYQVCSIGSLWYIKFAPLGHCDTLSLLHWVTVIH